MSRRSGWLALLFLLPALSLAGLPPFSGFVGKLGLVTAGFEAEEWAMVAVALVGSLLTLISMTKIWIGVFWGDIQPQPAEHRPGVLRHHRLMGVATWTLVAAGLAIAVFAGPLYAYAERAGADLVDITKYVTAVADS
jgi:multicomponent Na+:H+ antiporter subunit D